MISKTQLNEARLDLAYRAKQGIDFITAATIIWILITIIWSTNFDLSIKNTATLAVSGMMMPLALLFSKVYKSQWKIKENPLHPLGLLLNIAQLFYFPILVLVIKLIPDYFVPVYMIITGAHFFPYAWFYKQPIYAIMAGIISVGAVILSFTVVTSSPMMVPLAMAITLAILIVVLSISNKRLAQTSQYQVV
ncbi:hypothetical protein [uncultured Dokdonia sp.]|uniref:DUF7010 family protein n=1 Tax=uncultured Dokdonia sp. TaxID=575653 RepID=UPI00260CF357|nr:hypothetical protein [uncultured Dokdonia sp.]